MGRSKSVAISDQSDRVCLAIETLASFGHKLMRSDGEIVCWHCQLVGRVTHDNRCIGPIFNDKVCKS